MLFRVVITLVLIACTTTGGASAELAVVLRSPAIPCDPRNKLVWLDQTVIRHLSCLKSSRLQEHTDTVLLSNRSVAIFWLQAHRSPPESSLEVIVQHHTVSVGVRYVQQTAQYAVMRLMHAAQVGTAASDSHSCIGSACPTYSGQVMWPFS